MSKLQELGELNKLRNKLVRILQKLHSNMLQLNANRNDTDSNKAIFLHCVMICSYHSLYKLLIDPRLILFFRDDFRSALAISDLKLDYQNLSMPELINISKFSSKLCERISASLDRRSESSKSGAKLSFLPREILSKILNKLALSIDTPLERLNSLEKGESAIIRGEIEEFRFDIVNFGGEGMLRPLSESRIAFFALPQHLVGIPSSEEQMYIPKNST